MSDVQALYFKVNLGLTTHQRFARITPPVTRDVAVTVWLSVLDYTRTHELDGHCPSCVVQQPHREEAIAELLRVGLLTAYEKDGEHWLYLVNYERFNDTKAKIDARRQGANARKSKQRSRDVTPDVTRDIQRDGRVSHTLGHASVTSSETETETDLKTPLASLVPPSGGERPKAVAVAKEKTLRGTRVPTSQATDAELDAFCAKWGIDRAHERWPEFLDYWRGRGKPMLDWAAVWRNRLRTPIAAPQRGRQGVFRARDGGGSQDRSEDPYEVQQRVKRRDRIDLMAEIQERLGLVQGGKQ